MKYRKHIRFFCVSLVFALSFLSVCSLFLYNRHKNTDYVETYQAELLNVINFAFRDHVQSCEKNFNLTRSTYKDLLKEQAFALNANLNNIITLQQEQNKREEANQENSDQTQNGAEEKTAADNDKRFIENDSRLVYKLKIFQKNLNAIGYDFLIANGSKIIFDPLNKSLTNAKTSKFSDESDVKDYYILNTDDKQFLSFVFTNSSQYNFVFIKDITNLEKELITDRKHITFLRNLFNELKESSGFEFLVINAKDGKTLTSSKNLSEVELDEKYFTALKDGSINNSSINIAAENYLATSSKLDGRDYYLVSLCDESYISSLSFDYIYFIIPPLVAFITFLLVPIVNTAVSLDINRHIEKFNDHIASLKKNYNAYHDGSLNNNVAPEFKQTAITIGMLLSAFDQYKSKKELEHSEKIVLDNKDEFIKLIQKNNLPNEKTIPSSKYMDISSYLLNGCSSTSNFYNTLRIDENNLSFIIGSVKTEDAYVKSYVMTMVNTMAKALLLNGMLPNRVLGFINNELTANSQENLQVNLYISILNEKTGNYICANAGHINPVIISNEPATLATADIDPALGSLYDVEYKEQKGKLIYGQCMIFLSESLITQTDDNNTQYGSERLYSKAIASYTADPSQLLYDIIVDLMKFKGSKAIESDITLLSVQRKNIE